jgi:hypothetical protein
MLSRGVRFERRSTRHEATTGPLAAESARPHGSAPRAAHAITGRTRPQEPFDIYIDSIFHELLQQGFRTNLITQTFKKAIA